MGRAERKGDTVTESAGARRGAARDMRAACRFWFWFWFWFRFWFIPLGSPLAGP